MLPYILGYGPNVLGIIGTVLLMWFFNRHNQNLIQNDTIMHVGFILVIASFALELYSLVTLS